VNDEQVANVRLDGDGKASVGALLFGIQYGFFHNVLAENYRSHGWDVSGEGFGQGGTYYNMWFHCGAENNGGHGWLLELNGRGVNANQWYGT
jgi:hypothetical protein